MDKWLKFEWIWLLCDGTALWTLLSVSQLHANVSTVVQKTPMEKPKKLYSRKFRNTRFAIPPFFACACALHLIPFRLISFSLMPRTPTGILLIFFGKGMCNWSKQTRRRRKRYNGDESYLCSQIYLLGSATSKSTIMSANVRSSRSHFNSNWFSRRRLYSAARRLHVHIRDDAAARIAQQPNRWTWCHWIQHFSDGVPARQQRSIVRANVHRCEAIRFEQRSSVTGIQRLALAQSTNQIKLTLKTKTKSAKPN